MVTFIKLLNKIQKDKRIRSLGVILILLSIGLLSNRSILGFVYWDGPYFGRIVDAETGNPIEGAGVAGIWEFEHYFFGSPVSFANARETTTDKDGKFKLPLTFAFTLYPFSGLDYFDLLVFKPGYDSHPPAIKRKTERPVWKKYPDHDDGLYYVGKWVKCTPQQECLVKLNKTLSIQEERAVHGKMGFGFVPLPQRRSKLRGFITLVNIEGHKFGADEIPFELK